MTRARPTSVSLSSSTLALVARHAGGSRSAVIARALHGMSRSVVSAVATLRAHDLPGDEVRAAAEALRGYWTTSAVGSMGGCSEAVASELGSVDYDGCLPTSVIEHLADDRGELARSLLIVAEALDAGDAYVERAIERM